jgi:hypothetical protein
VLLSVGWVQEFGAEVPPALLQVPIHNVDEFVGSVRLLSGRLTFWVDDMVANVPFHNFRHEAVDGTAASSDVIPHSYALTVCRTREHSWSSSRAFSIALTCPLILLTRFSSFSLSWVVCAILVKSSLLNDTIPK